MRIQALLAGCVAAASMLQLAAAAPGAAAATLATDVLRTIDDAVGAAADATRLRGEASADGELTEALVDGGKYRMKFTGKISTWDPSTLPMWVTIDESGSIPTDKRDYKSSYVFVDSAPQEQDEFVAVFKGGAYMFKHVSASTGRTRFLAVHTNLAKDSLPDGSFRLIAHRNPRKAALWNVIPLDQHNFALVLVHNRNTHASGTEGMLMGVPTPWSERSATTDYLAAVPDFPQAGVFGFVAI